MFDEPVLECPRCGRHLRRKYGVTCPGCGFVVEQARISHQQAVSFWRFEKIERRRAIAAIAAWSLGLYLAYRLVALHLTAAIMSLLIIEAVTLVALSKFLLFRKKRY